MLPPRAAPVARASSPRGPGALGLGGFERRRALIADPCTYSCCLLPFPRADAMLAMQWNVYARGSLIMHMKGARISSPDGVTR